MGNVQQIPEKMSDRQKQVQLAQRELMMATSVAKLRDDFQWLCALHGTLGSIFILAGLKTRNPRLFIPLLPMSFSIAYVYDAAYGSKMTRIRLGAEEILAKERSMFQVPAGNRLISPDEYSAKIVEDTVSTSISAASSLSGAVSVLS